MHLRALTDTPPELRDVDPALRIEADVGRALYVGPALQKPPLRGEDLDAVVFPIGDHYAPVGGDADAVRQIELSGTRARLPPGVHQLTGRCEAVDLAVPVAIGNIEVATG